MKRMIVVVSFAVAFAAIGAEMPGSWTTVISPAGGVRIEHAGKEVGTLAAGLFEVQWQSATMNAGKPGVAATDGVHRGQIRAPGGGVVDVELRVTAVATGGRFDYQLTPQQAVKLNSLHVSLTLPSSIWAGGKFVADGKEGALPAQYKNAGLHTAPTKSLKIANTAGAALQFDFATSTPVLVQDDRQWGEAFSVRVGPQLSGAEAWPAGKSLALSFTLSATGGMKLEEDGPVTIRAGAEWLPLDVDLDIEAGSALDFSKVIPRHAPAGKFGRIIVNPQGKFTFAQRAQTPERFYGVNLCFSAHYLPREEADRLADRLVRLGYNALRVHHYERELVDRSTGVRLKPDKLEQLDYLFAALKQRGIYVTTDLFVSRPVAAAEIYEGERGDIGMDEFKMAVHVNERAFANFKAFARALLDHQNPHTKLRYADDPALAWLSLVNEDNPGNFLGRLQGKLRDDWQRAWNRWLAGRYPNRAALVQALGKLPADQDPAKGNVPLQDVRAGSAAATQFNVFLAEVERDFFERTRKFLRDELGCHALLTDCNAWSNPVQMQAVRAEFDYVDDHFYVDHPQFIERPWSLPSRCSNASPIAGGASGGRSCAFTRLFGKPFTITEFNYAAPGRFRGVGGILTGALGAAQDWDGIWRFGYSHQRESVSRPGAMNYFDIATDPLNQAAERASLCLFLRGDLQPAKHAIAIAATPGELLQSPTSSRDKTPPWQSLAWLTRVGWMVGHESKTGKDETALVFPNSEPNTFASGVDQKILGTFRERGWLPANNRTDAQKNRFQSENGEVTIDAPENTLTLDTARTAGGFAPAGRKITTRAATIEILDTDATVWVSSLDNNPIATSKRLLITHLTDLQNTEIRYGDRARQILLAWGNLPHLVRDGRATITLRVKNPGRAKVHSLTTSGKRLDAVTASVKGGDTLSIPLSVSAAGKARMLYEVEIAD